MGTLQSCAAGFSSSSSSAHIIPQDQLAGIRTSLAPWGAPQQALLGGLSGSSVLGKGHGGPCSFREKQLFPDLFDVLQAGGQALSRKTELDGHGSARGATKPGSFGGLRNPEHTLFGLSHLPISSALPLAKPTGLHIPLPCSRDPTSPATEPAPLATSLQDISNEEPTFPPP